jgi:outer membrane receptor for ferrienterochelin and colicin
LPRLLFFPAERWTALGALCALPASLLAQHDSTALAGDSTRAVQVFTLSQDELDQAAGSQDVNGLLQSSRDVFTSVAAYNFGGARFRIRGLDAENTLVSTNGVRMNDLESGRAPSQWRFERRDRR